MPYTEIKKEIVNGKEKWCFRNKETRQRICADTREKAVLAMRARYAHTQEFSRIKEQDKKFILAPERRLKIIKEG